MRVRAGRMMKIEIAGSGRYLPKTLVASHELDASCGLPDGHLAGATGVGSRYHCRDESQIDMALGAATAAITNAGLTPQDIDLVIGGCGVAYQALPATAPLVQSRLGIADGTAAAFDVSSTCLSFLSGFDVAARLVDAGQHRTALVFSSDMASRALPWKDAPETAALFGDGAAAVVLRRADGEGSTVRASMMRTYPSAYEACSIGAGGTRFDFVADAEAFAANAVFRMDGKELFRITSRYFAAFVNEVLERAGWSRDAVDLVIPHQASPLALAHLVRQTGFCPSRIVDISADYGNQIAASIPFAFDMARRDKRFGKGSKVLMLGTSAGVSFGGLALEI